MKARSFFTLALTLAVAAVVGPGILEFLAPSVRAAAKQLYTCGMHPQVIKAEMGDCPICGMKLTPVRANAKSSAAPSGERRIKFYKSTMIPGQMSDQPGKDAHGMDLVPVYEDEIDPASLISIDPITIQKMNLKTDVIRTGPVRRTIRAVGNVAFNEEGLVDITTKYEGWIEKLHANSTWAVVKAGDPLFEIYSPDLYNAQLNYVVALRTEGAAGGPLTNAARARMALYDVPDSFVAELARSGEARRTFLFRAPAGGVVIDKPAVQGMMIRPGERILRLADLSTVWVTAQIYEKDVAFVRAGQEAVVKATFGGDRDYSGKVDLLIPELAVETRTVQARLTIPNPELRLKPGMFVDVRFEAELSPSSLLVPDVAVLRSGERNTVFVAVDGGTFDPREVKLGARAQDGFYAVVAGLVEGERVVTSGQFMLDSESQLREAVQKMIRATEGASGAPAPAAAPSPAVPVSPEARPLLVALALAAADVSSPLGDDDLAGYQKLAPALRSALTAFLAATESAPQPSLVKFKNALSGPADLAAVRREFEPLSTAIADLARANRLHHTENLRIFECPMTPVLGKARWLQREEAVKNPFFGSKMRRCGAEVDPRPAVAPGKAKAGPELYTCPMASHADVVTDKPGRCPKCNMVLVPTAEVTHGAKSEEQWRKQRTGATGPATSPHAAMMASLPRGHPPLDAQTISSFLRVSAARPATPPAGADACCGGGTAFTACGGEKPSGCK